jgi:hypothetical protein
MIEKIVMHKNMFAMLTASETLRDWHALLAAVENVPEHIGLDPRDIAVPINAKVAKNIPTHRVVIVEFNLDSETLEK